MVKDFSKKRGEYTAPIELKYIQIPHCVYEVLCISYSSIPIETRKDVLWDLFCHFFTNQKIIIDKDESKYHNILYELLNEKTFVVQNNARWKCFDDFYEGRDDIDYDTAYDIYMQKVKDKKSEYDRRLYLRKKQCEELPAPDPEAERREGIEKIEKFLKELEKRKKESDS